MENIIEKAIAYDKDFFKNDFSGHDFWHTLRVYNNAKLIAKDENCDEEIVALAALLHDVDEYKLVGEQEEPLQNAKRFLRDNEYPQEKIEFICQIISKISFKVSGKDVPDSLEGKIVQDADRLDAIGAIGIARAFAFGGFFHSVMHDPEQHYREDLSAEDSKKKNGTTINHFYEKLLKVKDLLNTETAKKIAENRHQYMEVFLDEFYAEWDGKK